jgi:hypothetical protein
MLWKEGVKIKTTLILVLIVQGDQKVSADLMITSNVQSVPLQSPDIYWHAELFSKTVFSIARSTLRMWWPSWWLKLFKIFLRVFCTVIIKCIETFWSFCISGVQERLHSLSTPTVDRDVWSALSGLFPANEPLVTIQKEVGLAALLLWTLWWTDSSVAPAEMELGFLICPMHSLLVLPTDLLVRVEGMGQCSIRYYTATGSSILRNVTKNPVTISGRRTEI